MSSQEYSRKRRRPNLFHNDLRSLMYAFGDVPDPDPESVAALDDILQGYIIDICHEAARVARTANRAKIKVEDFKFAVRNDPKKLGRIEELLVLQKVIQDAKRLFDNAEGKPTKESKNEK